MNTAYSTASRLDISPAGGDTDKPRNLQRRLARLRKYLDVPNSRILDCGCGEGEYVLSLIELGADAWGIEYLEEKVAAFKRKSRLTERVNVGDIEHMQFEDNSFDAAILNEVIEHIPDDAKGLEEVRRVLKPGGRLVIFCPNRIYPFETHGVYLKGTDRRVPHYTPLIPYIPLPIGTHFFRYWARNYWPFELRRIVRAAGFRIVRKDYFWQTFENISNNQPKIITMLSPFLRTLFGVLERVPLVRCLGVSQILVAEKM